MFGSHVVGSSYVNSTADSIGGITTPAQLPPALCNPAQQGFAL